MEVKLDGKPSLRAQWTHAYYHKRGHDPLDTVTFGINDEHR